MRKHLLIVAVLCFPFILNAEEYKPLHRVFVYPKIGFSSNFANYNAFTLLANLVYRLSALKGLGLSWETGFSVTSMEDGLTYYGIPFRVGVIYEVDLQMDVVPYAGLGSGLIVSRLDEPFGYDSHVNWSIYGEGGVMYRLGKGFVAGSMRLGYSPLPKGSPVKANVEGFEIYAGYVYEF